MSLSLLSPEPPSLVSVANALTQQHSLYSSTMAHHQPAFNERLIQEVKKHPSLYNQTKRSFTDTMERMKIWDDIATAIDPKVTGEFAKKRWLQLRDRYRKELKVAIRQNFSVPQRWCYFSHLSWLDPYLKDNLALANTPGLKMENRETNSPFGIELMNAFMKTEYDGKQDMDDGFDEPFDEEMLRANVSSALERVLAATHAQRECSSSPNENDREAAESSTPSSTAASSVEYAEPKEDRECSPDNCPSSKDNTEVPSLQPSTNASQYSRPSTISQSTHNPTALTRMTKQLIQANHTMLDWINDEEMLFARLVGVGLKKMSTRRRKRVKAEILSMLDDSDNEDDDTVSSKSARMNPEGNN